MTLKTAVLLFCTISMLLAENNPSQPKADVILVHGNIYTGVEVPSSFHAMQRVEALAIRGDRVQAAGTESEILKLKGPQTQVINLGGHFVMPGFNDAHLHLASAGFRRLTVDLTGVLRETARDAVSAVVPKPTPEKRRQAIEAALQDLAQWGITSAQDNSGWEDFQVYEQLEREGKLTVRISEWLAFDDSLETLKALRAAHPVSDNMLHTGMLKGFMDGSLGSRTAALLEPYADDPKNSGLPQYEQARLTAMTKERADAGFQIGFHAIGDKGVQMALDAFASTGGVGTGG